MGELGALGLVELGQDGADALVVDAVDEQVEGAGRGAAALPGQARLVEGRRGVDPGDDAGLAGADLWQEIAEVLGLTESRICQIHSQAILAIRSYVERFEAGIPVAKNKKAA